MPSIEPVAACTVPFLGSKEVGQHFRLKQSNLHTRMFPLSEITESFGIDVSSHTARDLIGEVHLVPLEHIMRPCDSNSVTSFQMPDSRALADRTTLIIALLSSKNTNFGSFPPLRHRQRRFQPQGWNDSHIPVGSCDRQMSTARKRRTQKSQHQHKLPNTYLRLNLQPSRLLSSAWCDECNTSSEEVSCRRQLSTW